MISRWKYPVSCALFCAAAVAIAGVASSSEVGPVAGPREMYDAARSLAERSMYGKASKLYGRIVDGFPASPLAPEAKFRQAECLELMKNYYPAFKVYQELLEQYPIFPNAGEVADRQLRIGTTLMNKPGFFGRNLTKSRKIFRRVVHNAPFGDFAPRAQFNLAMSYEKKKLYSEAIMEYGKVINNYPGSDVVDDADYHIALCYYRKAKSSPHDQSAAEKAAAALKGFHKRYPGNTKAGDAKAKMEEIVGRKAKHLFGIAEYYEKTGSPKSAIHYYQEIIDGYPDLEIARRAEVKIRRGFELAKVDKRIEELTDELNSIKDEMAYSRSRLKRLRRPEVKWHVWKQLGTPEGPKGERVVQEKERLRSLGKESGEKKREIKKVLGERRKVYRVASVQLKLDESRRKNHIAKMDLEAAGDDRPGPSEEGYGASLKAYERELEKKRRKLERTGRAVSSAEERLAAVKENVESVRGREETRAVRGSRERRKDLRREEFKNKLAELTADLPAERRIERALSREERKQTKLLERLGSKTAPDEAAEAEAEVNLSLITSRLRESRERVSVLERDIERRRKIHELERRHGVIMGRERRAEAALHRIEESAYGVKKGPFSFFRGDPVSRSVKRLDRLRGERRRIESELSALTGGEDYITDREKMRIEKQAERKRRGREKAEAKERRKKEKELARERKVAEREARRNERLEEIERRARERAGAKERKNSEKALAADRESAGRRMKLEERIRRLLEQEEEAGAVLDEMTAAGTGGRKRSFLFFRADPARKAEMRLKRLREKRESLQRKLDSLVEAAPAPAG